MTKVIYAEECACMGPQKGQTLCPCKLRARQNSIGQLEAQKELLDRSVQDLCQVHVCEFADGLAKTPMLSDEQARELLESHVQAPFYPKRLKEAMIEIGFYWFENCKLKYRKI